MTADNSALYGERDENERPTIRHPTQAASQVSARANHYSFRRRSGRMHARRARSCLLVSLVLTMSHGAWGGGFGDPLRGLSPDELQRFTDGKAAFEAV